MGDQGFAILAGESFWEFCQNEPFWSLGLQGPFWTLAKLPPGALEYRKNAEMMPPGALEYRKNAEMMPVSGRPGTLVAETCLHG